MSAPCTMRFLILRRVTGVVGRPGPGVGGQPGEVVVVGGQLGIVLGGWRLDGDPDRPADGNRRAWEPFRLVGGLLRRGPRRAAGELDLAVPQEREEAREDRPLEGVAPAQRVSPA